VHSQAWTFVTHTWALWLFERRYNELMAGHAGLAESFYCVIITASTVGYGDTLSATRTPCFALIGFGLV
jgi:hypothetical protein